MLLGGSDVTSEIWEPDALTAHVRICEGANFNRARIQYCDTTEGKPVANREHKPYPKHERVRPTHAKDGMIRLQMETTWAVLGDAGRSALKASYSYSYSNRGTNNRTDL